MSYIGRSVLSSRCPVIVALLLFCVSALAQVPPFVPDASTGKQISGATANPDLITVQADPVDVEIGASVVSHPLLNLNSVNAVLAPASVLGPMASAGLTPDGNVFNGQFAVDASVAGSIDILVTAAYLGDPRRARRMVSIDVVQEPDLPTTCPPVCSIPDPTFGTGRILVFYFANVDQAQANQIAADVSAATSIPLTFVDAQPISNTYRYELEFNTAMLQLDEAIAIVRLEFLTSFPDFVVSVLPEFVGGGE